MRAARRDDVARTGPPRAVGAGITGCAAAARALMKALGIISAASAAATGTACRLPWSVRAARRASASVLAAPSERGGVAPDVVVCVATNLAAAAAAG